jgi:ABC-type multidrug transport system fused ATPase/permease subunit
VLDDRPEFAMRERFPEAERVLRADFATFQKQRQGDLQTRLVSDTSLVKIALSTSLAQLIINGLLVTGGIALMICPVRSSCSRRPASPR